MKPGIILRDHCPVCSSTSSKSIFNRSFNEELIKEYMNVAYQGNADVGFLEDTRFEIVKCNECDLSYQTYVLDEVRLNELYNKWIDPIWLQEWYRNNKYNKRRRSSYSHILRFAKTHLKMEPANIKVLDYGAGIGDSLFIAKEMGFDAYAYEYSAERIKALKEKGIRTIDGKDELLFDVIIVDQILEHLTHPDETLRVIVSKLNKNGVLFISVPNCSRLEVKLRKSRDIRNAKEFHRVLLDASVGAFQHINFFTRNSLNLLFKKHGITPIRPLKQLIRPFAVRSLIRPFYRYYFGTSFLLKKTVRISEIIDHPFRKLMTGDFGNY